MVIGFGTIAASVLLAAVFIQSLVKLNFFGVFLSLALAYMLYQHPLELYIINPWLLLLAAVLLSISFHILFGRRAKCRFEGRRDACGGGSCIEDGTRTYEDVDGNNPFVKLSFGSSSKYIHADALKTGNSAAASPRSRSTSTRRSSTGRRGNLCRLQLRRAQAVLPEGVEAGRQAQDHTRQRQKRPAHRQRARRPRGPAHGRHLLRQHRGPVYLRAKLHTVRLCGLRKLLEESIFHMLSSVCFIVREILIGSFLLGVFRYMTVRYGGFEQRRKGAEKWPDTSTRKRRSPAVAGNAREGALFQHGRHDFSRPKAYPFGWTFNWAHPAAWVVGAAIVALLVYRFFSRSALTAPTAL